MQHQECETETEGNIRHIHVPLEKEGDFFNPVTSVGNVYALETSYSAGVHPRMLDLRYCELKYVLTGHDITFTQVRQVYEHGHTFNFSADSLRWSVAEHILLPVTQVTKKLEDAIGVPSGCFLMHHPLRRFGDGIPTPIRLVFSSVQLNNEFSNAFCANLVWTSKFVPQAPNNEFSPLTSGMVRILKHGLLGWKWKLQEISIRDGVLTLTKGLQFKLSECQLYGVVPPTKTDEGIHQGFWGHVVGVVKSGKLVFAFDSLPESKGDAGHQLFATLFNLCEHAKVTTAVFNRFIWCFVFNAL